MNTNQKPASGRKWIPVLFGMMAVLAGVGVIFLFNRSKDDNGNRGGAVSQALTNEQVEKLVVAAAILENNQFDEAIKTYEKYTKEFPNSGPLARNLAIGRLEKIKLLISHLSKPPKELSEVGFQSKQEVKDLLPAAFESAATAAARAIELQPKDPEAYIIAVNIEQQRINQLPNIVAEDERLKLVEQLRKYMKSIPGDPRLAVAFFLEAEQLQVAHPELRIEAIEPLLNAFEKESRNLFLFKTISMLLAEKHDGRVVDFIKRFLPALRPFETDIKVNYGSDPSPVLEKTMKEIEQGNWENETDLQLWLNCIVNVTAFTPDSKRVEGGSALALIDLRNVEETLRNRKEDSQEAETKLDFEPAVNLGISNVTVARWYDWDIDLNPEVAYVAEGKLRIAKWKTDSKNELQSVAEVELPEGANGMAFIDLFEVQSAGQPKQNDAEHRAILEAQHPELKGDDLLKLSQARHDVYRDILTFGDAGIHVFSNVAEPRGLVRVNVPTGLEGLSKTTHINPCDWDGDGDLDLAIVADGKIRLMLNRGNRTFEETTSGSDFQGVSSSILSIESCDYDRDVDTDFIITTASEVGVLENVLHGQFRYRKLEGKWSGLAGSKSLLVSELDGNVSWDWVGVNEKGLQWLRTTTPSIGQVEPWIQQAKQVKASAMSIADLNNDGWQDIILASDKEVSVSLGEPGLTFANSVPVVSSGAAISVSIADKDANGALDLLAIVDGNLQLVSMKENAKDSPQVTVRLKGRNDVSGGGRINSYGVGSVVEIFCKNRYQSSIVRDDSIHFGLGQYGDAYNARIVFPNGLTQNIVQPKSNTTIEEIQAPKGSCPFLYGWDGERFTFITDLLWNAPLGLQFARGKTIPDRRWEHLMIPGALVQPKDGFYELRITEELWEAAYFDHVQLTAVDHPIGMQVFSNEKVGPPSIAEPRIWTSEEPVAIQQAIDGKGRDWTKELQGIDKEHALPFDKRFCQGMVETHYVDLHFGDISNLETVQLALTGWIFPTDTSLNIAIDQNPDIAPPSPPSLWVPDASGEFQCVRDFIGFPGGKTKTIVIDVSDCVDRKNAVLRVATSNEIYWDQAILFSDRGNTNVRSTVLQLEQADLHYRGFSKVVITERQKPHWFDYQNVATDQQWLPMDGFFTDFGDVLDLLQADDDRMIVMGSGDEVTLRFKVPETPLPEGWTRDFVLHNTGWDKDADLNTLEGQSSLPLPFKDQASYPAKRNQAAEARRVWELNKDRMHRTHSMRSFWKSSFSEQ